MVDQFSTPINIVIYALIILQISEFEEETMIGTAELTDLARLEDFIVSAKKGLKISAMVDLQKQHVSQKIHPENNEG